MSSKAEMTMNVVIVKLDNGTILYKKTKRNDVQYVEVSYHKDQEKIVGLYSTLVAAEVSCNSPHNPQYTNPQVVAVTALATIGLTGEDWLPSTKTKHYAQFGEIFSFGATEIEAIVNLIQKI